MIMVTGTFRLPADRLARALPAMSAMMAASRAEPGCIAYAYAQDLLDPALIHVVERWRDRAALAAHFAAAENSLLRRVWPYPRESPDFARPGTEVQVSLFGELRPARVLAEAVLDPQNTRLKMDEVLSAASA